MSVSRYESCALLTPIVRHLLVVTIALSSGTFLFAEESVARAVYRVNSNRSKVEFSIMKWTVGRQLGSFRDIDGTISMAADCPESAEVEIRIHARSLHTGNNSRDSVVRSEDFLDVENHPYITFRSVSIRRNQSGSFDVEGNVTIRGVTRRIVTPVRLAGTTDTPGFGEVVSFETAFNVDRREYGVLGSRWSGGKTMLGDDVEVRLMVAATRVD